MPLINYDPVDNPQHYVDSPAKCPDCGKQLEPIFVTQHMNFCLGNVIKYIWRHAKKGTALQDLKKARWYLDQEIKRLEPAPQVSDPSPEDHPKLEKSKSQDINDSQAFNLVGAPSIAVDFWVNVYPNGAWTIFNSKEDAEAHNKYRSPSRLGEAEHVRIVRLVPKW